MRTSLIRSIPFWLMLVLSLASAAIGGWLIAGRLDTMTTALLDGTATGVEVYVGQSLAVTGSVLLGAGVIGMLLALALASARSLLPASAPVVIEPIDWTAEAEPTVDTVEEDASEADGVAVEEDASEDQKGSSGSTATATKISVR